MILKKAIFIIATIILSSCGSNKIKLEKSSLVKFDKAIYSKYNSGIKSGKSGFNIHLSTQDKENNINISGIYFKNGYSVLKFSTPNIYTGFIITYYGDKDEEGSSSNKEDAKLGRSDKEKKLPFLLKDNEAIIACSIKGEKNYFKVNLTKKDVGIPQ